MAADDARRAKARVLNQSPSGAITIDEDLVLNGSVNGPVTVLSGVYALINGSINGDANIEQGAEVTVQGSVLGSVHNRGRLDVYGAVSGEIADEGGRTTVHMQEDV